MMKLKELKSFVNMRLYNWFLMIILAKNKTNKPLWQTACMFSLLHILAGFALIQHHVQSSVRQHILHSVSSLHGLIELSSLDRSSHRDIGHWLEEKVSDSIVRECGIKQGESGKASQQIMKSMGLPEWDITVDNNPCQSPLWTWLKPWDTAELPPLALNTL